MRLIDAHALQRKLGMADECKDCPNCTQLMFCGLSREEADICDAISEAQTIDLVKRGKWIEKDERTTVCSLCGDTWGRADFVMKYLRYCPNCGADMRGE